MLPPEECPESENCAGEDVPTNVVAATARTKAAAIEGLPCKAFTPHDADPSGYLSAREDCWNKSVKDWPSVIAMPSTKEEVITCVKLAAGKKVYDEERDALGEEELVLAAAGDERLEQPHGELLQLVEVLAARRRRDALAQRRAPPPRVPPAPLEEDTLEPGVHRRLLAQRRRLHPSGTPAALSSRIERNA